MRPMDPRKLASYPFLKEAAGYIRSRGIGLDDLLHGFAFEEARERGRARVVEALEKGEIADRPTVLPTEQLQEILSYPVARMLVSCVADGFLIRRYALAEGVTLSRRLPGEDLEFIIGVAKELEIEATIMNGTLRIHFTDYLRHTSRIRSKDWKLVNTEVFSGYVYLTRHRFGRVLQQALQDRIEEELPIEVSDDLLKVFAAEVEEIRGLVETRRERYKAEDLGRVSIVRFPPCMKRLVAIAQAGENMPHTGRFALTAFLHSIGMSPEEIINLFSASPDFDPAKTRYQVEHITGEISGTEYTPPECSTMRSYGICFDPDDLCRNPKVHHPLTYYRIKGPRRRAVEKRG